LDQADADSGKQVDVREVEYPGVDELCTAWPGPVEGEVDVWEKVKHVAHTAEKDAVVEVADGARQDEGECDVDPPLVRWRDAEEISDNDDSDECCPDEECFFALPHAKDGAMVDGHFECEDVGDD